MNDDTQQSPNPAEAAQPATSEGTTTLDLTHVDAPQDEAKPTDAEAGAAIVEAEQAAAAIAPVAPEVQAANAALAAVQAAGAHGVLSKLESELMAEYQKGQSSFLAWLHSIIAELKAHLKV